MTCSKRGFVADFRGVGMWDPGPVYVNVKSPKKRRSASSQSAAASRRQRARREQRREARRHIFLEDDLVPAVGSLYQPRAAK